MIDAVPHPFTVPVGHKVTMFRGKGLVIEVLCSCGVELVWHPDETIRIVQRRLDRAHNEGT